MATASETATNAGVVHAISNWINDQFEIASPTQLEAPPNLRHLRHFATDPDSGVSGMVYVGSDHVYYQGDGPNEPWWDMGGLTTGLRELLRRNPPMDARTQAALSAISNYANPNGQGGELVVTIASLAGVSSDPWLAQDGGPQFNPAGTNGTLSRVSVAAVGLTPGAASAIAYSIDLDDGGFDGNLTTVGNPEFIYAVLVCMESTTLPERSFLFEALGVDPGAFVVVRVELV